MKFVKTALPEVVIIEPAIFNDNRGYFFESFNLNEFETHIQKINFVQDNESKSTKGVLRGLHFQKPPFEQAKLVRCTAGKVLDVVVDIRKGSPNYGKHITIELTGENKRQLFVPRGFAHGYLVLSKTAIVEYKVDNWYAPEADAGIVWNDSELNIDWGVAENELLLSEKDKNWKPLNKTAIPFLFNN